MEDIKTELLRVLAEGRFFQAALRIGAIRDSAFCSTPYELCIDKLIRIIRVGRRPKTATAWISRINRALFGRFGMDADKGRPRLVIDEPDRLFLDRIIDNRSGGPLPLTLFYWHLADSVGLQCECLSLSSYYLLKVINENGKEFYIDPFEGGKILLPQDFHRKFRSAFLRHPTTATNLFERISRTQLVARLIQQLKQVYVLKGNALFALRAVELLTALFPESPEFARDRGILYCEMEYFSKAADDLKYYLNNRPKADDLVEIKQLSRMLRGYREIVN